jgi:integrase
MDAPAFPTVRGTRRNKDNVRQKVVEPVLARANANRAVRGDPPIRARVTPHTFRRTYITYAIAAGFDLPYVQAQVGHSDPTVTLSVYAQVIRRADRDQLPAEIRALLGLEQPKRQPVPTDVNVTIRERQLTSTSRLRAAEKAGKGRALNP